MALARKVYLLAPDSGQQYETASGTTFRSDSSGVITSLASAISAPDLSDLLHMGCIPFVPNHLGCLIGADMNVTTDNIIPLALPIGASFRVSKITVKNASTSLTTAAGGVYTAASKGGTALVASTQVYSTLTAAARALDLTLVATPGVTVWEQESVASLFLNLTTAQGAPATADVFVYGDIYWSEG